MNAISLPLVTALVAGFAHALEADHMAAVTTFVSRRPHPLRALGFGVRWGVGHSLALLLVGGVVVMLDLQLSERLVRALEFGVGALLAGLGGWAIGGLLQARALATPHVPARAEGYAHPHHHGDRRSTTWVGAAHGLAGTAGFLALLPAAFLASPWLAGGYLLFFGLGTIVAMGLYGLLAGALFQNVGTRAPALGGALRLLAALLSVAIGGLWMYGAVKG